MVAGSIPAPAPKENLINTQKMKVLTLIIKQKYFDEILAGTKKEEFRENRPNTFQKYCELDEEGFALYDEKQGIFVPKHYDAIRFFVGYRKDRQSALVAVKDARIEIFVDEQGEPVTYMAEGVEWIASQVVYGLGDIIEKNV